MEKKPEEKKGAPTKSGRREVKLPSGAQVSILAKLKGKHLKAARRAASAGDGIDEENVLHALIAQAAVIDGKAITMEDVDEMDLDDVLYLRAFVSGNDPSSEGKSSSA